MATYQEALDAGLNKREAGMIGFAGDLLKMFADIRASRHAWLVQHYGITLEEAHESPRFVQNELSAAYRKEQ